MTPEMSNFHTSAISKYRLELLFDGIFAIAMTILVLELKVPELTDRHSVSELARALWHNAPTFFSYLFSFSVLGMLWYRHNTHYRHFQFITRRMLALHFVQLSMAAFFPFCAALLGRCPTNRLTPVVYTACIMVYLWSSFAIWIVAKKAGALSPDLSREEYAKSRKRYLRGCIIVTTLLIAYLLEVVFL